MVDTVLSSGRDTVLVAIPILTLLLASMFRLDQLIAAPKETGRRDRPPCGMDRNGEPILTDPDGRPSGPLLGRRNSRS